MSQTLHRLQGWLRRPIEFILTSTCLEDVCGLRFLSLLSLIYSIRISWVSMVIRPIPTQISPQELDPRRQYIFREHPITQLLLQWLVLLISRNEQWLKFSKEVMVTNSSFPMCIISIISSFIFIDNLCITSHNLFIHSPVDGYFGYFLFCSC